jgi:hypothetical protein
MLERTQVAQVRIVVVPVLDPRCDDRWIRRRPRFGDLQSQAFVQLRQWVHRYLDMQIIEAVV